MSGAIREISKTPKHAPTMGCQNCKDRGFGRPMQLAFPSAPLMRSHRAKRIMRKWCRAHDLHNAGCEVRFARNKKAVSSHAKPQYMIAKGVVSDAMWAMHGDLVVLKGVAPGEEDEDEVVQVQPPKPRAKTTI